MKKTLLSAAFIFAAMVGANAQYSTSFETSEGFIAGDVNGQNGWTSTELTSGGNITDQSITTELATDGTQSLKITRYGTTGQQNPIVGAFYEFPTPFSNTSEYEVTFDFYGSEQSNNSSDFLVVGYTAEGIAFYLRFRYNGTVFVADEGVTQAGTPGLILTDTQTTWLPQTWYNARIVISESEASTKYYINDNLIFTSTGLAVDNTPLLEFAFIHDNYMGYALLDNLSIGESTASVKDNAIASFTVYPNPANDVINVSNAVNAIEKVVITDMNGRVVKSVVLGVNEAQINISDLSKGVYFLQATSNGASVTEKIVKK